MEAKNVFFPGGPAKCCFVMESMNMADNFSHSSVSSNKDFSPAALVSVMQTRKDLSPVRMTLPMKPSTRKRAKKPIDAPRRPKSAYMFFLAEFREAWKEKYPDQKRVSAVAQAAGEKWRSMTPNEKEKFENLSLNSKLVYKREMAEYLSKNPRENVKQRSKRPPESVRRPTSAYLFFLQTFRTAFEHEHPGVVLSATEMSRLTTEKWRSMTPEEKDPYQEMSLFSKQEYKRIKTMTNMERMAAAAELALGAEGIYD